MALSNDLISEFVRLTNDKTETPKSTTAYGTIVESDGIKWVQLDGSVSGLLTPIETTIEVSKDDRVIVDIKDHTAIVTGNLTNQAMNKDSTITSGPNGENTKISDLGIVIASKVSTDTLNAEVARINKLEAADVDINNKLTANEASIGSLETGMLEVKDTLTAVNGDIDNLEADNVTIKEDLSAANAEIENLKVTEGQFKELDADYADFKNTTTNNFTAVNGEIENLETTKLSVESADIKYVNIDRTNIDQAWIKQFYVQSGILNDAVVDDATFTGELVAVLIDGDLIKAGTLYADKLFLNGGDDMYYQLNLSALSKYIQTDHYKVSRIENFDENGVFTHYEYEKTDEIIDSDLSNGSILDGIRTKTKDIVYSIDIDGETLYFCKTYTYINDEGEVEGVPESGIHGKAIIAQTITADQIKVSDLTAFGATIAGFVINSGADDKLASIHTHGKDDIENDVEGIYLDKEGQFFFGNDTEYIKGYKVKVDGVPKYIVDVSASSITFGEKRQAASELENLIDQFEIKTIDEKTVAVITDDSSADTTTLSHDEIKISDGTDTAYMTKKSVGVGKYEWSVRSNGNYGLMWKGATD